VSVSPEQLDAVMRDVTPYASVVELSVLVNCKEAFDAWQAGKEVAEIMDIYKQRMGTEAQTRGMA
jgi:hypothetical protein